VCVLKCFVLFASVVSGMGLVLGQDWEREGVDFGMIESRARDLANREYAAPDKESLPEWMKALTYDQYRDIRFDPERALWGVSRYELTHHVLLRWQLPTDLAAQIRALDPSTASTPPNASVHGRLVRCTPWIDLLNALRPDGELAMDLGPLAPAVDAAIGHDGAAWLPDALSDCRAQARALTV